MASNKSNRAQSPSSTNLIVFNSIDANTLLRNKTILRFWIRSIVKKEKKSLSFLSFNFCSDDYLLKMNKKFLKHNFYTDIITFDLCEDNFVSGDIYISLDRVKENAKSGGVLFHVELERVLIHGVLHLCGYKDKTEKEVAHMRKKEDNGLLLLNQLKKSYLT